MKKGFALTAALAIAAMTFTATTADAQSRKSYRYYGGDSYQPNWNAYGSEPGPRVHGRRDPSSYDGVRTGQPADLRQRLLPLRRPRRPDGTVLQLTTLREAAGAGLASPAPSADYTTCAGANAHSCAPLSICNVTW